ncbi:unnamed protein product [Acanthosepion pharaonis]|uniref:Uncharacterized protein n=1 Tax=Acanthosepion pharaonis TaxID=158019 RepID=A0A812B7S3_ACAPH|nr:unnamed protein product [Sepia pharaonis]
MVDFFFPPSDCCSFLLSRLSRFVIVHWNRRHKIGVWLGHLLCDLLAVGNKRCDITEYLKCPYLPLFSLLPSFPPLSIYYILSPHHPLRHDSLSVSSLFPLLSSFLSLLHYRPSPIRLPILVSFDRRWRELNFSFFHPSLFTLDFFSLSLYMLDFSFLPFSSWISLFSLPFLFDILLPFSIFQLNFSFPVVCHFYSIFLSTEFSLSSLFRIDFLFHLSLFLAVPSPFEFLFPSPLIFFLFYFFFSFLFSPILLSLFPSLFFILLSLFLSLFSISLSLFPSLSFPFYFHFSPLSLFHFTFSPPYPFYFLLPRSRFSILLSLFLLSLLHFKFSFPAHFFPFYFLFFSSLFFILLSLLLFVSFFPLSLSPFLYLTSSFLDFIFYFLLFHHLLRKYHKIIVTIIIFFA